MEKDFQKMIKDYEFTIERLKNKIDFLDKDIKKTKSFEEKSKKRNKKVQYEYILGDSIRALNRLLEYKGV